jgi:uncharacterized membrane protein
MLSGGCLLVVVGAVVGVGLVYLDLWPVGLWVSVTMTALGVAAWVVGVRGKWRQVISIDSDVVVVETGQRQKHRDVFSRAWVRLEWHHFNSRHYVSRLYLRSRGHRVEIGSCLTPVERQTLAQQLEASLPVIPA